MLEQRDEIAQQRGDSGQLERILISEEINNVDDFITILESSNYYDKLFYVY